MAALFACTKCNSRYPFEELSQSHQLCKTCRGMIPFVKCTYCRTEYQDISPKGGSSSVCKKCDVNLTLYGQPTECQYCNIVAAFIGSKCQRCANSQKRYGDPIPCEQCKQKSAFDRNDDSRKKVDGKLLCWLCTLSYKRALAKTKHGSRHSVGKSSSSHHRSSSENHKRSFSHVSKSQKEHSPSKKSRIDFSKYSNGSMPTSDSMLMESGTSDHVVAIHQLKEQIAILEKKLLLKDQEMLRKEKAAGEARAQQGIVERELRLKIQAMQKHYDDCLEDLQSKNRVLQKQVITLGKGKKFKSADSPQRL